MATRVRITPYGRLFLSISVLILLGWVLLMLPCMSVEKPATWLESLFTSTSAICVTGLIVRSTGHDWTFLGQVVLLLMIQIGGLGFMTLSSSVLMHLRQKVTLGEMKLIRQSLGGFAADNLPSLLKRCLRIVLSVEAVGAGLLFIRFVVLPPAAGQNWFWHMLSALWAAIFHSVSAFCNAGFSIWDESLVRYANDIWVNVVMGGLIILGGLGFFVLADLEAWLRARKARRAHSFRFQTRLVLTTTLALLIGGTVFIWLAEHLNADTLKQSALPSQVMMSLFQSLTARTAGFNTVEVSNLSVPSIGVLIILMFIGASPGSCGGGIKTTTFAVLMVLSSVAFRHGTEPTFANRTFSRRTVGSAIALFFAAFVLVLLGSVFLLMVEGEAVPLQSAQGKFAKLIFEATSAFGTVGLSTGITPELKTASKLCLVVLMVLGRLGPLGLISATLRGGLSATVRYPQEDVQIG